MPKKTREEFRKNVKRMLVLTKATDQLEDLMWSNDSVYNSRFLALAKYIAENRITETEIEKALNSLPLFRLGSARVVDSGDWVRNSLPDEKRRNRAIAFFHKLKAERLFNTQRGCE